MHDTSTMRFNLMVEVSCISCTNLYYREIGQFLYFRDFYLYN